MQNLRKKFPVLQQCIYANTAATGLMYEDLMEWRQEHDLDFLIGGSDMKQKWYGKIEEVREDVGRFFGCNTAAVALVPNFTVGLNLILEGLRMDAKVLLVKDDYPSLNWPFETRDFQREYVAQNENLESALYEQLKKGNFDVLALSLVQWVNGIKIDMEFLKTLKQDFPDLMIIADGTQFCGTQPFNFETSGIDILGASAYKWMLAGYGNGFFLMNESIKENIDLKVIGNWSVDRAGDRTSTIELHKLLQPGHLDSLNFGSLQFSLNFLDNIGMENVQAQLKKLSQNAKLQFSSMGLLDKGVQLREDHSTIFNIEGDSKVFQKLSRENVVCVQRGSGIRLSFHFYNTENEVDAIVDILKS
ncbi:aminotransferase class V-fold PLP-dependent enzyme [Flagellimonas myxillae]|uniref:aminotransferase class V-fold PLP-dependent enzyme n=1 Tax=Flagellimonas myxillae TaxID=2942214 RepID=UPI00201E98FE|nr:aminotransferase class V-fold PLP-dependent enzyme [Muricauda myxillae]MCL6268178.1 aminotransferase class V-fold PLP-dependent enzyme [Muricauda myxillae]